MVVALFAVLLGAGLVTTGVVLYTLPERFEIQDGALVLAGAVLIGCGIGIVALKPPARGLFLLATVVVIEAYTLRLVALTLNPEWFSGARVVPLAEARQVSALVFAALGISAYWIGLWVMSRAAGRRRYWSFRETALVSLRRDEDLLIRVGVAVQVASLAMSLLLGRSLVETDFAFIASLLPTELALYVLASVAVVRSGSLPMRHRVAVAGGFGCFIVGGIATGTRGSVFVPVVVYLVTTVVVNGDPRVRLSRMTVVGVVGLLALGPVLSFVVEIRNGVRSEGVSIIQMFADPLGSGLNERQSVSTGQAIQIVSTRQAAMDALFLVSSARPDGLNEVATSMNVLESAVQTLIPDRLLNLDSVPSGRAYATFYQGIPPTVKHHGGFSGLGFAFAYGGWIGGMALMFFMGIAGSWLLMRAIQIKSGVALPIGTWFAYETSFHFFELGNLDEVAATGLRQVMLMALILLVAKVVDGARSRRSERPAPKHIEEVVGVGRSHR